MSDEILSIQDMNLIFNLKYFAGSSLKDSFVECLRDPLSVFLRPKESLHVLKNINLSVYRGDRVALLGVNGSGKTSLCRSIVGMLCPHSGRISVQGDCRAVFESNVGIIGELTGIENARLLARFMFPKLSSAELSDLVMEAAKFSELKNFLNVPFENYSQGMKSRLFLSVATALPADLLILDEIYDNADIFFKNRLNTRLSNFINKSGAVIFVSHSHDYIKSICNRGVVLREARIVYDGELDKALRVYNFLENPQSFRELSGSFKYINNDNA